MISIIYCTREHKPEHKEHLIKSSGLDPKKVQVIEYINNGVSLTKAYNEALKETIYDTVVFCHDDINIESSSWGKKLLKHFEKSEYGILGVAGTKEMGVTGRWWDNNKAMYGRVKHTHEGKSWLSAYSDDLGNKIEEVVLVDGLFFAIRKSRVKRYFDETVEGFHFYDVEFCFMNKLCDVKIGVITNIRVNHYSIGQTNQEWEDNRIKFIEKYNKDLPLKIPETFENKKMKVLLGCLSFSQLTGSELSTLELAKELSKNGCDVSVISFNISQQFINICKKYNIKLYHFNEPPFYKLGDGNWRLQTPNGITTSKLNVLYKLSEEDFDIIQTNHTPVTEKLMSLYPNNNFVTIVRSEVIDLENPIVDKKIKKYIAIRPSIKEHLIKQFNIDDSKIDIIYNLFNKDKFKPRKKARYGEDFITLFVGTMDYLRKKPILSLIDKCEKENKLLHLVGKDSGNYAKDLANKYTHVTYFESTDKIEYHFNNCDETAGIMLGRTTIEGFLCNKPAIIYNVNKKGEILTEEYLEVPKDLSVFDNNNIINKYKNLYKQIYNQYEK